MNIGRVLSVAASCWLATASGTAAQNAALPPHELFFKPPAVLSAKLSPSGKRVAISTPIGGERVGLFVWSMDKPTEIKTTARFVDVDVNRFDWLDDDRLLFDVIDRSLGAGEQEAPGLFVARHDGDDLRMLVMREGMPFVTSGGGVGRTRPLTRNHRLMHIPAGGGDEVVVGELQGRGNELEAVILHRLDVATGRARKLTYDGPAGAVRWLFDSAGEPRVAETRSGNAVEIHWRGPGETGWRRIGSGTALRMPFTPRFVDGLGQLYVERSEGPQGTAALVRFDFQTGRPAERAFVVTPGFDFRGALVAEHPGGRALGVRVETDAESTVWFDERLERIQAQVDEKLPGYVNQLSCRRCDRDDIVVLVHAYSARDPGHLWLYHPEGARLQLISRVRNDVDPQAMAQVDFQRLKARDGRELPVWLTIPPGRKAGDKGPAVVLVHGGPWVRGGSWRWQPMAQFLASRGYLVISPEFRGSAGYGLAHLRAGFRQWGRAMQDDVADAALWARREGWADRFCIAGASYGGYSALMGLVNDPELYRCGVAWVAVADLLLYLKGSWWIGDDISESARRYRLPEMVGDPTQDAAALEAVSPVILADRIKAPLLLAYGERDLRVPIQHGERLRQALRAAGRDPEWLSYPGEGHGWLKTATHVDFARRVEGFLERYLK